MPGHAVRLVAARIRREASLCLLQCDVDSLCGVPLSASMKALLGQTPDWCSVLKECKVKILPLLRPFVTVLCSQLSKDCD